MQESGALKDGDLIDAVELPNESAVSNIEEDEMKIGKEDDAVEVPEESVVRNIEEYDDQTDGDHESIVAAVVEDVPFNEPVPQDGNLSQSDLAETSTLDMMHLGAADGEVGKIFNMSEKELLHPDEKDIAVSVTESTGSSDVEDDDQISQEDGIVPISSPEPCDYHGADDALDASEQEFCDPNVKESIFEPATGECSGELSAKNAQDELPFQNESASDPVYPGISPENELSDQDEKKSVSVPETFEYLDENSMEESSEGKVAKEKSVSGYDPDYLYAANEDSEDEDDADGTETNDQGHSLMNIV